MYIILYNIIYNTLHIITLFLPNWYNQFEVNYGYCIQLIRTSGVAQDIYRQISLIFHTKQITLITICTGFGTVDSTGCIYFAVFCELDP